ncbi:unnamed protein product [Arabis nemorensis]|uniref:Uncharacterized protein n=1 Tax=Arabis nemorensis TaxID=586526 RepID=A0A565CGP6_9BRAS|nr:unnamed protein product [Arabis nemorensis]
MEDGTDGDYSRGLFLPCDVFHAVVSFDSGVGGWSAVDIGGSDDDEIGDGDRLGRYERGDSQHLGEKFSMAEEIEKSVAVEESLMEKIAEKIHHHDSSSSSESECEKPDSPSAVKAKIYCLFGREKPVHKVLGGGKRMGSCSRTFLSGFKS